MPFLHLPVQSGSDRMLKAMNRGHTAEAYLRIIEALRAARPDMALSSDFIVGHPGETEPDFRDTMALVEQVEIRPGIQLQIFGPARHPRRRRARTGAGGRQGPPAVGIAGAAPRAAGGVQRGLRRADRAGTVQPAPAATPARSSGGRLGCSGCIAPAAPTSSVPSGWWKSPRPTPIPWLETARPTTTSTSTQPATSTRREPPLDPNCRVFG